MTYSERLGRHIMVTIEQTNKFDEAELDAAIAALPNYPETSSEEIRQAAKDGNRNARLVIEAARTGDPVAQDWYWDEGIAHASGYHD